MFGPVASVRDKTCLLHENGNRLLSEMASIVTNGIDSLRVQRITPCKDVSVLIKVFVWVKSCISHGIFLGFEQRLHSQRLFSFLKAHANGRNKSQHCCVLLGVFGQQCYVRLHEPKKFDRFQTIRNKCQQVPTLLWFHANGRNMLGLTMLCVVGQ